jgi:dinuclear metal center YbgI/SA1388 family protein
MEIRRLLEPLENIAPLAYQESYDNSGLIIGDYSQEANSALICFDITESVIDEAAALGCGLIISHHPLVFSGMKRFSSQTETERCVAKAIIHGIAVYSSHTSLDNSPGGINKVLAEMLGVANPIPLAPLRADMRKLVAFVPQGYEEQVKDAVHLAGGGNIGNYSRCSFSSQGVGSFMAGSGSSPFVGLEGKVHNQDELRIEFLFAKHLQGKICAALIKAHPYEKPAFDIINIECAESPFGGGAIGFLNEPVSEIDFLSAAKEKLGCQVIRHSKLREKPIHKVAVCGGSGASLISRAAKEKADIYITGDVKYHDFGLGGGSMVIADAGHYETEHFSCKIIHSILSEKFPTFALNFSRESTNHIQYL